MSGAGLWVVSILLFIISLGVLIAIHELGHFLTAKMFNVYVQEYAIGMGPRLFSRKRKYGETYFSIRAVPFGGFCAMYGEETEVQEGVSIPKERSISGVAKWKRAIIFAAGIIMNFAIAYVLFFINDAFFPQMITYAYVMDVVDDSLANQAGILRYDGLDYGQYEASGETPVYFDSNRKDIYLIDQGVDYGGTLSVEIDGVSYTDLYLIVSASNFTISQSNFSLNQFKICSIEKVTADDPTTWKYNFSNYTAKENLSYSFTPRIFKGVSSETFDPDNVFIWEEGASKPSHREGISSISVHSMLLNGSYIFEDIGMTMFRYRYMYGFGEAFKVAGEDWCSANTLLFRAIGNLFIGQGWGNVGGPIAIITQTTSVLSEMGFGYYIWYWGAISCNLAIFNLLPFPGLDGWHLLVIGVEAIFRKEIPNKVKNAISFVGMILLFGLMIAVVIKDIIALV